jgi:hypothetical protein
VWIVSNEQLLAWMKSPTTIKDLGNFGPLKCSSPMVNATQKICNGVPQNEVGLLQECTFADYPFYTCVSCFRLS